VESVAQSTSSFLAARGDQDRTFLNGDRFGRWGGMLRGAGWTGRSLCAAPGGEALDNSLYNHIKFTSPSSQIPAPVMPTIMPSYYRL
jgi:hypothetical protein